MNLSTARAQVAELIQMVGWLSQNVLPGTGLPYRPPQMSPEKRASMDAQAREERHERSEIAPGDSPAPYSFEIAELLTDILIAADNLADLVGQAAGVDRLPSASSAMADPTPYLRFIDAWLDMAAEADPDVLPNVDNQFGRLIQRSHETLGLVTDGQLLRGALCPFCGGRSSTHPTGGAPTLRVRTLPGVGPVVVCEGGACQPTTADCGTYWRGLPAWDLVNEGAWLADRIERAQENGEAA